MRRDHTLKQIVSLKSEIYPITPLHTRIAAIKPEQRKIFFNNFTKNLNQIWLSYEEKRNNERQRELELQHFDDSHRGNVDPSLTSNVETTVPLQRQDAFDLLCLLADGLGQPVGQQLAVFSRTLDATSCNLEENEVFLEPLPLRSEDEEPTMVLDTHVSQQQEFHEKKLSSFFKSLIKKKEHLLLSTGILTGPEISREVQYCKNIENLISSLQNLSIDLCIEKFSCTFEILNTLDSIGISNNLLNYVGFGILYLKNAYEYYLKFRALRQRRVPGISVHLEEDELIAFLIDPNFSALWYPQGTTCRAFKNFYHTECRINQQSTSIKCSLQLVAMVSCFGLGSTLATATSKITINSFRDTKNSTVLNLLKAEGKKLCRETREWLNNYYINVLQGQLGAIEALADNNNINIFAAVRKHLFERQ
jgi:hypothetical protein